MPNPTFLGTLRDNAASSTPELLRSMSGFGK